MTNDQQPADECAAISTGHHMSNCGPNGEIQCRYCGESPTEKPAEPGRGVGEQVSPQLTKMVEMLRKALDANTDDESLYTLVIRASNALYWRGKEIEELRAAIAALTQPKAPLYVLDAVDALNRAGLREHANNLERYFGLPTAALSLPRQSEADLSIVRQKLTRFEECAEDGDSGGCDIGREWFDALTTIGLLERTQRSPAIWTMTPMGEAYLTTPQPAQADTTPAAHGVGDELITFLNGSGTLEGVWFGEKHPTERGVYWWRKHLPSVQAASAPGGPTHEESK